MSRTRLRLAACLLALSILNSCSFDYSDAQVEREPGAPIPQVEILGAQMVIERNNRLVLRASRLASFPDEGYQEFTGLHFSEYGPDGDVRLEGQADAGVLELDTENVELRGTVRFYSTVEEAEIKSEFLSWDSEARILVGPAEGEVELRSDAGSRFRGRGMVLDGRRNSLSFENGVDGVYRSREAEEE